MESDGAHVRESETGDGGDDEGFHRGRLLPLWKGIGWEVKSLCFAKNATGEL
jgi:hypothetical protein